MRPPAASATENHRCCRPGLSPVCYLVAIWPSMGQVSSYLRSMGSRGLGCCSCWHLSGLFIWLGGFCHAATQRRLGPLWGSRCCLGSKSLYPRWGVGMEKVWLPVFGAFVEDRNGNVAWSELGVYWVAFPCGQQPGAFTGRAIGRGCGFLKQSKEKRRLVRNRTVRPLGGRVVLRGSDLPEGLGLHSSARLAEHRGLAQPEHTSPALLSPGSQSLQCQTV